MGEPSVIHYGPLHRRVLGALFDSVQFPGSGADEIRALAARGTVVYVMRSSFFLHLVFLNHLATKLALPLATATSGLAMKIWRPLYRLFWGPREVRSPRRTEITSAVGAGESALVFLRRPRTLTGALAPAGTDPFPELCAQQRTLSRPIFLVPLTFIWQRPAGAIKPTLWDRLFGDPDEPGPLRATVAFLLNRHHAFIKVGRPVNLADVVTMDTSASDASLARKVRGALYQHLAREVRVVTGPPKITAARLREETLRDLTLRNALAEEARTRGLADGTVAREAARNLDEIAAKPSVFWTDVIARILSWVFRRIYNGVEIDEAAVERLTRAAATAPVVLCPSHKSHVDYLIMSYALFTRGMMAPHIAAGDNLSFFPLGWLLRRAGAYYIRRSFKSDRVYSATLRAYIKRMVRDSLTQEFFIEGGRSRTGKLLLPKYGMVSMEVDAWLEGAKDDILFVPISIQYERIAEAGSYAAEAQGAEKKKEDVRGLLSLPSVLRRRLGKIFISLDEPISLAALAKTRGLVPGVASDARNENSKRAVVRSVALNIVAGINRATPLTPMGLCAMVLLAHARRGLSERDLESRLTFLLTAARDVGARPSHELLRDSHAALQNALATLVHDELLRANTAGGDTYYAVPEEHRLTLDYHKNTILHFFVAPALICASLGETWLSATALQERVQRLSRLFKLEFVYEVGVPLAQIVDTNLEHLRRWGLLESANGKIGPAAGADAVQRRALLTALLRPFLETYFVGAEALALLEPGPLDAKEWVRRALDRGRAAYLAGRLQCVEALNRPTMENALEWLVEQRVVTRTVEKPMRLSLADPAHARLEAELAMFLQNTA